MNVTISDGTTTLELPADLLWTDRHSWSPVEQNAATSITGALIVDSGTRINGRPITLAGDESHAWMPYSIVDQLKAWAAVAGKQLVLTIDGTAFDVIFRHHDAPAIDVSPVVDYNVIDAQDWFFGMVKLTEV